MRADSLGVAPGAWFRSVVTLAVLAGCATQRPGAPIARLVAPAAWGSVVDCVMLSARAQNYFADVDSAGIVLTPGLQPFGPFQPTTRTSVRGRVRVGRAVGDSAVLVTTEAFHWAAQAFRRDSSHASGPAWTVARQLDAQCLGDYDAIAVR
jgi:hypothetical protein